MTDTKRVVALTDREHRLTVNCLRIARNELIADGTPVEEVSRLMLKVIEAPTKKEKRRAERAGR